MEEPGAYDVKLVEPPYQLFVDEIDAAQDGYNWLNTLAKERKADSVTPFDFEKVDGGVAVAWKDGFVIAYFMILRNWNNYSILVKTDLGDNLGLKDEKI